MVSSLSGPRPAPVSLVVRGLQISTCCSGLRRGERAGRVGQGVLGNRGGLTDIGSWGEIRCASLHVPPAGGHDTGDTGCTGAHVCTWRIRYSLKFIAASANSHRFGGGPHAARGSGAPLRPSAPSQFGLVKPYFCPCPVPQHRSLPPPTRCGLCGSVLLAAWTSLRGSMAL